MSIFRNNIKGFHLELTNICTLKCPACPRTQFINKFPTKWKNHSIDLEILKKFLDVDLNGIMFNLCGNYGDPIYYNNILSLCVWLKSKGANISLTTNGSYQKELFWQELSAILDSRDKITWSIDGIPNNFTQYRINGDWNSIKQGIDVVTKTSVRTEWKYIIFKFNEDTIEQAKQLATSLGIQLFKIHKSDRWAEIPEMKPSDSNIGNRYANQQMYVEGHREITVDPECSNGIMHYITAEGYYTPCCYIGAHQFYYKTVWGNYNTRQEFDISKISLTQLLSEKISIDFEKSILQNPCDACKFNCPKRNV